MYNREEALNSFYKKLSSQVNFKKQAAEINSLEYQKQWKDFEEMEKNKEFEANFHNGTWEDFVNVSSSMFSNPLQSYERGYDHLEELKEDNKLEFLFIFIVGRNHESFYRHKETQHLYIYEDGSGALSIYNPITDDELRELMILACKDNN